MKLQTLSFLALTTTYATANEIITCLLNNDQSQYSSCCLADNPICTYLACEMGERPSSECSCSTLVNFCNELSSSPDVVVPQICAPSTECCAEETTNDEFQKCMIETSGEVEPTSFLELNSHLIEKEVDSEPVVVAAKEDTSGSFVSGLSIMAATFGILNLIR